MSNSSLRGSGSFTTSQQLKIGTRQRQQQQPNPTTSTAPSPSPISSSSVDITAARLQGVETTPKFSLGPISPLHTLSFEACDTFADSNFFGSRMKLTSLEDGSSIATLLSNLNVQLKCSEKVLSQWQEYIVDVQRIETVGELVSVIKQGRAWSDFELPTTLKIAIEEALAKRINPKEGFTRGSSLQLKRVGEIKLSSQRNSTPPPQVSAKLNILGDFSTPKDVECYKLDEEKQEIDEDRPLPPPLPVEALEYDWFPQGPPPLPPGAVSRFAMPAHIPPTSDCLDILSFSRSDALLTDSFSEMPEISCPSSGALSRLFVTQISGRSHAIIALPAK